MKKEDLDKGKKLLEQLNHAQRFTSREAMTKAKLAYQRAHPDEYVYEHEDHDVQHGVSDDRSWVLLVVGRFLSASDLSDQSDDVGNPGPVG